jgi:phosphoglycolate phosphatase
MRLKQQNREHIKAFIGPSIHLYFEEEHQLAGDKLGKAVTHYREYYTMKGMYENRLCDNTKEMLNALTFNKKKVYLVTGKPKVYAREILRHFNIEQYFTGVYGSELGISNQSKEELLEQFLENENADNTKCLMVGDRMHDIAGARYHNIKSAAVTYGFGSQKELEEAGPDFMINSPLGLLDILGIQINAESQ